MRRPTRVRPLPHGVPGFSPRLRFVWYKPSIDFHSVQKPDIHPAGRVRLRVNGGAREFPAPLTIAALLGELGLPARRVAVERNREVVRRDAYDTVSLGDGDVLEIVQIVGGG